jgi:hypothetical protein
MPTINGNPARVINNMQSSIEAVESEKQQNGINQNAAQRDDNAIQVRLTMNRIISQEQP